RQGWYWRQILLAVLAFVAIWVGVVVLGDSWLQLVLAAALGVTITQFGFLGHDAAHRQMFVSGAWNDWTSRILSAVFAGLCLGWWKAKHNLHHANPNMESYDPDISSGVLAFTRADAERRRPGPGAWLLARQGWLFFPMLTFEGLNLHYAGLRQVIVDRTMPHRRLEITLVAARLTAYVVALALLLPPGLAVTFFVVQMAVFGVCLGGSFAPNHKGMPIVPRTAKIGFLERQVLMSRNVRGGVLVDFAMGGLNYQIEHHLFPSMPRPNLRLAQPTIRAYCDALDVSYTEVGLVESYGIVIDYLNNVGIRARGPFECPLAADLR
ncbi:MAG: acyl-CoA desaturase, partial [Nocardioidaceae bacterium]|nr:acyl-CoA desaturase [Nocardioidaceae bacterium]